MSDAKPSVTVPHATTPAERIAALRDAWAAAEADAHLAAAEAWFEAERRSTRLGTFEPQMGARERVRELRGNADAARDAWLGALVSAGFAEVSR